MRRGLQSLPEGSGGRPDDASGVVSPGVVQSWIRSGTRIGRSVFAGLVGLVPGATYLRGGGRRQSGPIRNRTPGAPSPWRSRSLQLSADITAVGPQR